MAQHRATGYGATGSRTRVSGAALAFATVRWDVRHRAGIHGDWWYVRLDSWTLCTADVGHFQRYVLHMPTEFLADPVAIAGTTTI